jgi:enterochelin esterase-like enzyme
MRALFATPRLLLCCMLPLTPLAAQQLPRLQSPEVANDGRVTFRFRDVNAQKVLVNIAGAAQPLTMVKDADGVWSATSDPMRPDLYSYTFNADGVTLLDPSNSAIVPNLLNPSSVLHVRGTSPQPWEQTDIARGEVHHHFYRSAIVGDNRDLYVYTPPGYNPRASTRYPVLYLLHGYSDDASAWTAVGRANVILDSLIGTAQAKPMIIVMPLGYGDPAILHPTPGSSGGPFSNLALREKNFSNFRAALTDEVIPIVEKNYNVIANREARAIAGLSMGGSESLLTGLNRLDTFAWVASFSAGGMGDDFASDFPQFGASANDKLRLLWIACGTEDHLITLNRNFVQWLKAKDIRVTAIETPGMHTWMVWRRNLINLAPLLFRDGDRQQRSQ